MKLLQHLLVSTTLSFQGLLFFRVNIPLPLKSLLLQSKDLILQATLINIRIMPHILQIKLIRDPQRFPNLREILILFLQEVTLNTLRSHLETELLTAIPTSFKIKFSQVYPSLKPKTNIIIRMRV